MNTKSANVALVATSSSTVAKVVSDATESDILTAFRTLHGKVLNGLQECEIKAQFPTEFSKCGAEDYKLLHQQARTLIAAKRTAKWEARVSGIRSALKDAMSPFFAKRAKAYATFSDMSDEDRDGQTFNYTVTIPVSALVGCFPQGATITDIVKDLRDMSYSVFQGKDETYSIKVQWVAPKAEVSDKVVEETPKSDTQTKAA